MTLGTLGKYERISVLGRGVSGIVYLAKDTLLNKQVALKEVDVEAGDLTRFLEEARVMDRLRHPNIVHVNGVERLDGKVIIDMEYVRGQNLQEMLRAQGRLPLEQALHIAAQILDALDYAHRMQTVHRDIKPANILITREGVVKLVDFGLAEILATNAYAGGAGTYAYMAPEDYSEESRSDSQSDIWAVGITLYEMLTGQRPFQVANTKSPFAWKRALETQTPIPLAQFLPDAPEGLQEVLAHALERDKGRRYQTAGEFRDDLQHLGVFEIGYNNLQEENLRSEEAVLRSPYAPSSPSDRNGYLPPRSRNPLPFVPGSGGAVQTVPGAALAQEDDPPTVVRKQPFSLFKKRGEALLSVEPTAIDFGAIRWGETRSLQIKTRVRNGDGKTEGRVVCASGWLTAHPAVFAQDKQTITLTAQTDQVSATGDYDAWVRVETRAGTETIPVHLSVLKPRPTFLQVALWFVPLFIMTLFPALSLAVSLTVGMAHGVQTVLPHLILPAVSASLLLSIMLLLIGRAADIGIGERLACGGVMATMCFVLGICMASIKGGNTGLAQGISWALLLSFFLGGLLCLQLLSPARWKFWGAALSVSALLSSLFLLWMAKN